MVSQEAKDRVYELSDNIARLKVREAVLINTLGSIRNAIIEAESEIRHIVQLNIPGVK